MKVYRACWHRSGGARHLHHYYFSSGGFNPLFLIKLIFSESILLSLVGGILGVILTFPAAELFSMTTGTLFPVFEVSRETVLLQLSLTLLTGLTAAILPSIKASNINITSGLRTV